jgi:hypothetical protein
MEALILIALLLTPFLLFLAALRFIPQATRQKWAQIDIPVLRKVPKTTLSCIAQAAWAVVLASSLGWPVHFGHAWADNLFWAVIALMVGVGLGNWEAEHRLRSGGKTAL